METQPVLVLRHTMEPHRVVSWQAAICLVYLKKADVLEEYDETASSPSVTMQMPAVIRLRTAVPRRKKGVKFSRMNVATRDGFRCQYCGHRFPLRELNYDHVKPRVHGGETNWENILMSCYSCNQKKGGRYPEEAGMVPLSKPVKPQTLPLPSAAEVISMRGVPVEWEPYLDGYGARESAGADDVRQAG